MERVRNHFKFKLERGVLLSTKELLSYASKNKIEGVSREEVALMRLEHKFLARYEKVRSPKSYMKTTKYRYGVCQTDLGFMDKKHREFNEGCWGFIVCVEVGSLQVALEPVKDKTSESYKDALRKVAETSSIHKISVLLSDRERALTSPATVKELELKYGIKMKFLSFRNKAYLAELFVSIVKKMLGVALAYAKKRGAENPNNWIKFLKPVEKHLNSRKVPGTNFSRSSVHEFNYMQMRNEQENGEAYTNMNIADVSSRVLSDGSGNWNKHFFKYKKNEKVLLDLRALKGLSRRTLFHKAARQGGYSKESYLVAEARLKSNKAGGYTPVYKVRRRGKDPEPQWFYEADLQKISPAVEDSESSSG